MRSTPTTSLFLILVAPAVLLGLGCASSQQSKKQESADLLTPFSEKMSLKTMPSDHQKAEVKLALAQTLENAGQLGEAMQAYTVAWESGQDSRSAHRLAVLHDQQGQHDKAREYYNLALEQGGDRPTILCDYGYSLYLQKDYAQADTVLREALASREDFPRAHTNLALVLARLGDLPGALDEFRRAGCDDATARVNLAYSLVEQERWQEATLAARDALQSNPASENASILLGQLQARLKTGPQPESGMVIPVKHVSDVPSGGSTRPF